MAADPRDDFTFTPLIISFVGPDVSDWKRSRWPLSQLSQLTNQTESSLLPSGTQNISSVSLPRLKLTTSMANFNAIFKAVSILVVASVRAQRQQTTQ